jgi:hypothetical protein
LRPGTFALYRAILTDTLTTETLFAALPNRGDRRWSRLTHKPLRQVQPEQPHPA